MDYEIIKRCTEKGWEVWWNGEKVWTATCTNADHLAGTFADALERGITGSKTPLMAHTRVRMEGFMEYLEDFDSYEDYKGD